MEGVDDLAYLGFSGGKDSAVMVDIARKIYPSLPAVFVDTGLEFPEIRDFVRTIDNVEWVKPRIPFNQVLEKYGYPVVSKEQSQFLSEAMTTKSAKLLDTRLNGNKSGRGKISKKWRYLLNAPFKISHKCCDVMKKNPSKAYEKRTGRQPIIGTMAGESQLRLQRYLREGCNSFSDKRSVCTPMSIFTDADVWEYIRRENLPYSVIYDERDGIPGEDRTGCMFCMFGCHKDNPNRFQKMKVTHPKQYDYCMNKLGLKTVLDFMGVPY